MTKSAEVLARLIEERLRPGADHRLIDRRIQALFEETWCVVFTDMAGFSRRASRGGIIPFLVLIHQLDRIVSPILSEHAGLVLKKIADSHLILFRDPVAALRACVEMQQALERHNDGVVEEDRLYLGCGLGFGKVLKLGDDDVFGTEVNAAAKLGEDLAGAGKIFLTPSAAKAVRGKVKPITLHKVAGGKLLAARTEYFEARYPHAAKVKTKRPTVRSR